MLFVPVCKFAKLNPEADNILSILFLVKIFWIVNKRLQIRVWYTHRKNTSIKCIVAGGSEMNYMKFQLIIYMQMQLINHLGYFLWRFVILIILRRTNGMFSINLKVNAIPILFGFQNLSVFS